MSYTYMQARKAAADAGQKSFKFTTKDGETRKYELVEGKKMIYKCVENCAETKKRSARKKSSRKKSPRRRSRSARRSGKKRIAKFYNIVDIIHPRFREDLGVVHWHEDLKDGNKSFEEYKTKAKRKVARYIRKNKLKDGDVIFEGSEYSQGRQEYGFSMVVKGRAMSDDDIYDMGAKAGIMSFAEKYGLKKTVDFKRVIQQVQRFCKNWDYNHHGMEQCLQ